jgi:hypothetical protein
VIVVYKVDRLTSSVSDFAKLVEMFDKREVSFVCVTQSFNATTSMGRTKAKVEPWNRGYSRTRFVKTEASILNLRQEVARPISS